MKKAGCYCPNRDGTCSEKIHHKYDPIRVKCKCGNVQICKIHTYLRYFCEGFMVDSFDENEITISVPHHIRDVTPGFNFIIPINVKLAESSKNSDYDAIPCQNYERVNEALGNFIRYNIHCNDIRYFKPLDRSVYVLTIPDDVPKNIFGDGYFSGDSTYVGIHAGWTYKPIVHGRVEDYSQGMDRNGRGQRYVFCSYKDVPMKGMRQIEVKVDETVKSPSFHDDAGEFHISIGKIESFDDIFALMKIIQKIKNFSRSIDDGFYDNE
jgi:hypothetical protein